MVDNYKSAAQGEGALSSPRKDAAERGGRVDERSTGPRVPAASAASWDPYQVWLTRVKQPRDRSARRVSLSAAVEPAKSADLSETARLRALSVAAQR